MIDLTELERRRVLAYRRYFRKLSLNGDIHRKNIAIECYLRMLNQFEIIYQKGTSVCYVNPTITDVHSLEDKLDIGRSIFY
jgi:hypothetical protein